MALAHAQRGRGVCAAPACRTQAPGRLAPGQAAVVVHRCAWSSDPGQSVSFYAGAKRLSEAQRPTPQGGQRWHVAAMRGILRSPLSMGMAYRGRTRPAPARRRQSALEPVGPGQSRPPTATEAWMAVPVPAIMSAATFEAAPRRLDRQVPMARRHTTT
jgi:hypothetical protein